MFKVRRTRGHPAMKYVRLGTTGLKVSRLGLGCMSYGDPTTPGAHEWSLREDEAPAVLSAGHGLRRPVPHAADLLAMRPSPIAIPIRIEITLFVTENTCPWSPSLPHP